MSDWVTLLVAEVGFLVPSTSTGIFKPNMKRLRLNEVATINWNTPFRMHRLDNHGVLLFVCLFVLWIGSREYMEIILTVINFIVVCLSTVS